MLFIPLTLFCKFLKCDRKLFLLSYQTTSRLNIRPLSDANYRPIISPRIWRYNAPILPHSIAHIQGKPRITKTSCNRRRCQFRYNWVTRTRRNLVHFYYYSVEAQRNYQSTNTSRELRRSATSGSAPDRSESINSQQDATALPDDFKYGPTVSRCAPEIKNAFVRKVYIILRPHAVFQMLASAAITGLLAFHPELEFITEWIKLEGHTWAFYILLFATFINFGIMQLSQNSRPWNFIFLTTFTLLEACSIGAAVSIYDKIIVFQALLMASGVFFMLALFTLYSKHDFSGIGPFFIAPLIALGTSGIVAIYFPFHSALDVVYAVFGCFVFSSYTIYDTHMIHQRVSHDEYTSAVASLYVDFIGVFINIFRFFYHLGRGSGGSH